jgi:hypothetical protein
MIGDKLVGLAGVGLALWLTGLSVDAQTVSPPDSLAGINITLPSGTFDVLSLTPADMPELKQLSDAQLEVFVNALETIPQTPFSALPNRSAGSYFSLAHPDFPPFPGDVNMLPVWKMNGFYVLNDLNTSNDATATIISSGSRIRAKVSGPPAPGGGGTNTVPQGVPYPPPNYGTNLWIANVNVSAGYLNGLASNTLADVLYEVRSSTNLTVPFISWQSEGFFSGPETTNCVPFSLWQNGRSPLFIRLLSYQDTYDTGIPDWWWLQYFGQITNVNASASAANDGFSNLQKFQMGIVPTNYYNPNPLTNFFGALDTSGTNAFIYWSRAPGPVAYYAIQRGLFNTALNGYMYTSLSVSSNVLFFKDSGAITNNNAQKNIYRVWAVYSDGYLTATDSWQVSNYTSDPYGPPGSPPQPIGIYAYAPMNGTTVQLSWIAPAGPVSSYTIWHAQMNTNTWTYFYTNLATAYTNTLYTDSGAINSPYDYYEVQAVYPGGGVANC